MGIEIERKFLIEKISDVPLDLSKYRYKELEQGYICTAPVIRVRRSDDDYFLTVKGQGMLSREEHELPLSPEAYQSLIKKADGIIIKKRRYLIPLSDAMYSVPLLDEHSALTLELDIFSGAHDGLIIAEIEFTSESTARLFAPPEWLSHDVTYDTKYHNSELSRG